MSFDEYDPPPPTKEEMEWNEEDQKRYEQKLVELDALDVPLESENSCLSKGNHD